MSQKRFFPLHRGSTSSNVLKIMSTNPLQFWRLKDLFAGVKSKKVSDVHAVSDALTTLIRRGLVVRKRRGIYKLADLDQKQKKPNAAEAEPKSGKPEAIKEAPKPVETVEDCSRCEGKLFASNEIRMGLCSECVDELGKDGDEEEVVDGEEETRDIYMDELVQEISSARAKFRGRTGKALDKIVFVREGGRNVRLLITYTKDEIIEL